MDRDTELTAYLLRYLCDSPHFKSVEQMAETLGISKRQVQRLLNNPEAQKGGSIALSRILQYFALHQIPFDPVLRAFADTANEKGRKNEMHKHEPAARVAIPAYQGISASGMKAYEYYREFIGILSIYICPSCHSWCNPWDGSEKLKAKHCFLAEVTKELMHSIENTYEKENGQEGEKGE